MAAPASAPLKDLQSTVNQYINTKQVSPQQTEALYNSLKTVFAAGEIDEVRGVIKQLNFDNISFNDYFVVKPKERDQMKAKFATEKHVLYSEFIKMMEGSKDPAIQMNIGWLLYFYEGNPDKIHVLPLITLLIDGTVNLVTAYDCNTESMCALGVYVLCQIQLHI